MLFFYKIIQVVHSCFLQYQNWYTILQARYLHSLTSCYFRAVKGVAYVIHVASPFPNSQPKDENEVIQPAVEGTQNILKACVAAKTVKRVVLTSSCVAVNCKFFCLLSSDAFFYRKKQFTAFLQIQHTKQAISNRQDLVKVVFKSIFIVLVCLLGVITCINIAGCLFYTHSDLLVIIIS